MESSQTSNEYGICQECNNPNTFHYWCQYCNSERFRKAFNTWTSGNKYIDKYIQNAQTSAKRYTDVLEWIPYDRLIGIKYLAEGGFSVIYTAIWLDGYILGWDYKEKQWVRCTTNVKMDFKNDVNINKLYDSETINIQQNSLKEIEGWEVVIKNLNDSSNIAEEFFDEWERHFSFQKSCGLGTSLTAILYGITQNPETLDYMIVMMYVEQGSLRHRLTELANKTWSMKSEMLYYISSGLSIIHNLNLVHRDLHSGNILSGGISTFIVDLGLSRPTFQPTYNKNNIYGILPYIAPEILNGEPYSQASDVYSLGVIMSELSTGHPAYYDREHGLDLAYSICKGHRPEFANGTPQKYIDLANQCMNADASKRPTAIQLEEIFNAWRSSDELNYSSTELNSSTPIHPKAIYTSRHHKYTDLPDPVNSIKIPHFDMEKYTESQEINFEFSETDFL